MDEAPGNRRHRQPTDLHGAPGDDPQDTPAERIQRQAIRRTQVRHRERTKKQGSLRFWLVLLTLIATAVIVTVAMFETLYYVMG